MLHTKSWDAVDLVNHVHHGVRFWVILPSKLRLRNLLKDLQNEAGPIRLAISSEMEGEPRSWWVEVFFADIYQALLAGYFLESRGARWPDQIKHVVFDSLIRRGINHKDEF